MKKKVLASLLQWGTVATVCAFDMQQVSGRGTAFSHASTRLYASEPPSKRTKVEKKPFTLADLREEMKKNPAKYEPVKQQKYRRTRKRVENPKQKYVYKSQRELNGERVPKGTDREEGSGDDEEKSAMIDNSSRDPLLQAKEFGLMAGSQHCDPVVDGTEPSIVGRIRVAEESGSGSYAYLIDKPAGWSILGGSQSNQQTGPSRKKSVHKEKKKQKKRVKVEDDDGSTDVLEYSETDMLALMTPEELEEYYEAEETVPGIDVSEAYDVDTPADEESDIGPKQIQPETFDLTNADVDGLDPTTVANLRRIAARSAKMKSSTATFAANQRPSVVSWLKSLKAEEGTPIRGGNFWAALAGATEVDDSGLVLLCPKASISNIFVEYAEYTAVTGTGGHLAPKSRIKHSKLTSKEAIKLEVTSRLRKGRGEDIVQSVKVTIPDCPSTCSSVVDPCQGYLEQGIRGDPAANPFDRRARRRLIHCGSLSASSLVFDETMKFETPKLPNDISILAERRIDLGFNSGAFTGRSVMKENPLTTAYREINGVADGFAGWTVDRYDKWLLVQHDQKEPKGPLPSIHDGNTAGVYYMPSNPDRSAMGSEEGIRPRLFEGQPAPDTFTVLENGVKYLVSLDKDLSTGIFLDQRPQRAWLAQNCCSDTHVLNCFAHTGAFSVAAATAGASTVSLDLSRKWLDRLPQHFEANGVEFDERHDCIYGDCFDWLTRLSKRGEKYDIVILDPPSSSVGRKKKRWSVKNDMDELVTLASGMVKSGGLLWTTTNSAALNPIKFARLCQKGLEDAGIDGSKLERIQPMPFDFPTIGPQPVKNLVWRIP